MTAVFGEAGTTCAGNPQGLGVPGRLRVGWNQMPRCYVSLWALRPHDCVWSRGAGGGVVFLITPLAFLGSLIRLATEW